MKKPNPFPIAAFAAAVFVSVRAEEDPRVRVVELERQNRLLKQEMSALREESARNERQLAELKLAVAGILDSGELRDPERREEALLLLLREIAGRGTSLGVKVSDLVRELRAQYRAMPESAERAAMLLKLESIEHDTDRLILLLKPTENRDPSQTSVLAVDAELRLAVLSVGSVHGVFPGMIYHLENSPVALRVVAVRGFVSAAAIENGEPGAVNPGMRCFIKGRREENRDGFPVPR